MTETRSSMQAWTSREVRFVPFPTEEFDVEEVAEALCDHYWNRPAWVRRFVEPTVAADGSVLQVSGLPWWMPNWWARRTVSRIVARHGYGGEAHSRTVLTQL